MAALTATLVIPASPTQPANTPFSVTGTYQLSSPTWTEELSYEDNHGAVISIASPQVRLGVSSFTFTHPGLPAGTHTITIKDPLTGTAVTSNSFTVSAGQIITANAVGNLTVGTSFTFTGSLSGFTTAPPLTYRLDGNAPVAMTGVTTTGWSMVIPTPAAGSHTIQVIDASLTSAVISFTVAAVALIINPVVPAGTVAGATFSFTGSLSGYKAIPTLAYAIDGGAKVTITGVTVNGWAMTVTAPAAGSHTIVVTDGTNSGSASFTTAAAAHTITAYAPAATAAGQSVTFSGVLQNYATIPALTYAIDGGTKVAMTGVTVNGWAMAITAPAAGTHSIVVSDGTVSSTAVSFTTTAASGTPKATWNPADLSGVTLSNNNLTATATGSTTPDAVPQGVRATLAVATTGAVAWEVTLTALSQDWSTGVADTAFSLTAIGGLGYDTNGIGAYPDTGAGSQPAQTVYYNNNQLAAGNGTADAVGDVLSIVCNGTNFFFSTPAMRTTAGVNWNNSTTANPATNVGGLAFANIAAPYYPCFSALEGGGAATLNDGTAAFSAFLQAFLAANPSVATLSGQTPAPAAKTITPTTPSNVVAGTPFTFIGTLGGGYGRTVPALTYSVNGATPIALPGVAAGGWSTTLTIAAAGSHTIVVTDGTVSGSTGAFTVAAAASGPTPSPNNTVLLASSTGSITDAGLNIWTIVGGVVYMNGAVAGYSANVTALLYVSGTIYQENSSDLYYPWTGTTWGSGSATNPIGTPSGGFNVAGGQIVGPSGTAYLARGINLYDHFMGSASENTSGQPLTSLFPGLNFIRLNCYSYNAPSYYATFIQQMSALGIVVVLEDHTGISDPPYTGSALTAELNWYSALATAFIANPYVWFGTFNEPSNPTTGAITTQHVAIVNAIRGTGSNAIVLLDLLGGGNPGTVGVDGGSLIASSYSTMTNVVWDYHFYAYEAGYPSTQAGVNAALIGSVSAATGITAVQSITSANGLVPVIIGEFGNSTDGANVDADGALILTAVCTSGYGYAAWGWNTGQADNLTDGNGNLTSYGQTIAGYIAAASTTAPTTPPVSGIGFTISASPAATPSGNLVNVNLTALTGQTVAKELYGVSMSTSGGTFSATFANAGWRSIMQGLNISHVRLHLEVFLPTIFGTGTSGNVAGSNLSILAQYWNTVFPNAVLHVTGGWPTTTNPTVLASQFSQIATYLKGQGVHVSLWDVFNEPDLGGVTESPQIYPVSASAVAAAEGAIFPALLAVDSSYTFGTSCTSGIGGYEDNYFNASLSGYPGIKSIDGHWYNGGSDQGTATDLSYGYSNSGPIGQFLGSYSVSPQGASYNGRNYLVSLNEYNFDYNGNTAANQTIVGAVFLALMTANAVLSNAFWSTAMWDGGQSRFGFPANGSAATPQCYVLSQSGQRMPGSVATGNATNGLVVLPTTSGIMVINPAQSGSAITGAVSIAGLQNTSLHQWVITASQPTGSLSTIAASALSSQSFPPLSVTIYYP